MFLHVNHGVTVPALYLKYPFYERGLEQEFATRAATIFPEQRTRFHTKKSIALKYKETLHTVYISKAPHNM